ncbi:leucine-rich repeat serine/threonine-protein kinase 1-like isoform X3 [Asterias amurensis]|uniref:leucine-rich repeat serine/threonine-protein kinase 1-like isoform X3 n=1 Tax=Asterias amurensis TaxID=7602 RepID=UPI003AB12072
MYVKWQPYADTFNGGMMVNGSKQASSAPGPSDDGGGNAGHVDLSATEHRDFQGKLLHQAAIYSNVPLLEDLLKWEQKRYINERDSFGRTALHSVCAAEATEREESIECIRLLLESGADPNIAAADKYNFYTPLHIVAKDGKVKIANLLVQYGADLDNRDIKRLTPLELARVNFQTDCVNFLQTTQVERERLRSTLEPDLLEACSNVKELRKILRRIGFNAVNLEYKETPLYRASLGGHLSVVQFLLAHNANGRPNRDSRQSPLYAACLNGHFEVAKLLLQRFPAMASDQTNEMEIPLHAAAKQGNPAIIKLLLEFDYKSALDEKGFCQLDQSSGKSTFKTYKGDLPFYLNLRNINGQTALYLAASAGHVEVSRTLLDYRPAGPVVPNFGQGKKQSYIEVDSYTVIGLTPLHSAVIAGNIDIVSLLLKHGADVNLPVKSIKCLFGSRSSNASLIEGRVIEKVHIPKEDSSILCEACSSCEYNIDIIALLLKHGAKDPSGKALLSATLSVRNDIVTTILAHTGVHPDPDYTIREEYQNKFKAFVNDLAYASEGAEGNTKVKISRDVAMQPRSKAMARQDSKKDHMRKGSTYDRKRTFGGIKRAASNAGMMDTAVAIDWHDQNINEIKREWLVEAGLRFNGLLRAYPLDSSIHIAAATLTRIDVSDNSLGCLPLFIFQLPSLQQLNASKNKIFHLPGMPKRGDFSSLSSSPTSTSFPAVSEDGTWDAPVLRRINLSHNRLNTVPSELFLLPVLDYLNLEDNTIREMPFEMWMSPKLKTLNLSKNRLEDMPSGLYPSGNDSLIVHPEVQMRSPSPMEDDLLITSQKRDTFPLIANRSEKTGGKLARFSGFAMKFGKAALGLKDPSRNSSNLAVLMSTLESGLTSRSVSENSGSDTPDSSDSEVFLDEEATTQAYSYVNIRRFRLCSTGSLEGDTTEEDNDTIGEMNSLETLDLSHNNLLNVPSGLPCLAPKLTKLVLSRNRITHFGPMNKYPVGLVDLELSWNRIKDMSNPVNQLSVRNKTNVFRLLRSNSTYDPTLNMTDMCYSPTSQYSLSQRSAQPSHSNSARRMTHDSTMMAGSPGTLTQSSMGQFCKHRRHRVLATLRTLDLSYNQISQLDVIARTVLGTGASFEEEEVPGKPGENSEEDPKPPPLVHRGSDLEVTLLFPSLNALSVAHNDIAEVPTDMQYLTKLSSLKLNGNSKIMTLPPELGRLSMYDLKVDGCRLVEPLASMFKTGLIYDVLGYLRSILDDAKPYTRMKLMFVGKSCIGKTTLLNELRGKEGVGGSTSTNNPETFAERQGNTNIGGKTMGGKYLSTVGVDVSEWTYCKKKSKYGKVTFSTWDFGGQEEFYATHQYFLTKRSLYLVLFKITDRTNSINLIQQWLVNIQARAPNSPVLLVGTHYDVVLRQKSKYSKDYWPEFKRKIMERFVHIAHPQDMGLPNVLDCIEICCLPVPKSYNVGYLRDRIYDVAYSLTEGRDKDPMLMQRVPTSYLALEKAVMHIASEMRKAKTEPVVPALEYRTEVTRVMLEQSQVSFHDKEDLMQATRFLHNNGILLHYEDSMLSDYYFLDPQWLCDTLAKIVTIPEINPDVKKGVMLIEDLHRKFEDSSVKEFILTLLNKCEVAVTYDNKHVLVPSRLPVEGLDMTMIPLIREQVTSIKEHKRTPSPVFGSPSPNRQWNRKAVRGASPPSITSRNYRHSPTSQRRNQRGLHVPIASSLSRQESSSMPMLTQQFNSQARVDNCSSVPSSTLLIPGLSTDCVSLPLEVGCQSATQSTYSHSSGDILFSGSQPCNVQVTVKESTTELDSMEVIPIPNLKAAIRRLYILQYIPSGFWSHLISRFLSDKTFCKIVPSLYPMPERLKVMMSQPALDALENKYQWIVWQTGIELRFFGATIFHVKEIVEEICSRIFVNERRPDFIKVVSPDGSGSGEDRAVSLSRSGQLEIMIPNQTLKINQKLTTASQTHWMESGQEVETEHIEIASSLQVASRLLSTIMDLIDTLMENFYPSICEPLGITFQGELFITRLVPCNRCWRDYTKSNISELDEREWEVVDRCDFDSTQQSLLLPDSPYPTKRSTSSNLCCGLSCADKHSHGAYSVFTSYAGKLDSLRPRAYAMKEKERVTVSQSKSSEQSECTSQADLLLTESQDMVFPDMVSNINLDLRFTNAIDMNSDPTGDVQVYGFLFEMLVLQAMKTEIVTCPVHGRVKLSTIAPDVVFHDLGPALLVDRNTLEVRRLLGSGTFGLVFKGHTSRSLSDNKVQVAIKMLQPYPPGQGAGNTDKHRFEVENNKWQRDPLRFSCEAYRTARKELSIMLNLDHPQIVPLIGFCRQPMSLVLELAPEGALDTKLEDYKRVGARLTPISMQKIIVQVSSAIAYLHWKGIIYRDLKAENVLVWSLPAPHSRDTCVKVKLADYGISVSAMPSGTKGYGGTPGFMAPEIVQYDGKEKYTEKVDCFSFAMFMYELMSVQRPFENLVGRDFGRLSEIIKQLIKDGQRPVLTKKEKLYPTYIVDLMAWCWSQASRDRPTMEQINNIARMMEFPNLKEVMSPQDNEKITCACAPPVLMSSVSDADSEDLGAIQPCVWLAQCREDPVQGTSQASVVVLNVDRSPGDGSACVKFNISGGNVDCMCAVGDTMWLGLSSGAIAIYGANRNAFRELCPVFVLPRCLGKIQVPKAIVHISARKEVFVAIDHRIIVIAEEGGILKENVMLKYVEFNLEVFTLVAVPGLGVFGNKSFEIWCGLAEGHIDVVDVMSLTIKKVDLNHHNTLDCVAKVSRLVTYDLDLMEHMDLHHVWSCIQPGPIIYKWNVKTKSIEGTLDIISALSNCQSNSRPRGRTSLRPMNAIRNQVSSLALYCQYLYIGVSSGNILIAEPHTLTPLSIINCHEGPVNYIIPVPIEPWVPPTIEEDSVEDTQAGHDRAVIVTAGRGFNDVIGGYSNSPIRVKGQERLEWYFLLWEASNWEQGYLQVQDGCYKDERKSMRAGSLH